MNLTEKYLQRFAELKADIDQIQSDSREGANYRVQLRKWFSSSLYIIGKVFGEDSPRYLGFQTKGEEKRASSKLTVWDLTGEFEAAYEDFQKDLLLETKTAIEADLFEDFLEQAEHLLEKGYLGPAGVIAGCVLEDALRKLCERNDIDISKPTINPMNDELAKKDVYSRGQKKEITYLADVRNDAAHGHWDNLDQLKIQNMIRDVRIFMNRYFEI